MVLGRVADGDSGASLEAVEVALVDSVGGRYGQVLTDASGRFIVPLPANGTYLLHAARLGYDSISGAKLVVDSSETVTPPRTTARHFAPPIQ
jgi:Carboxypeptidase regulatory-like domain